MTLVRALLDRSRERAIDQLAAGVAYFAFLALVPLLLLATAVAGFLLDSPDAQQQVAGAITGALPGLGAAVEPGGQLDELLGTLVRRRGSLGLVGGLSLLWVGVRLAASLMAGVELAFAMPRQHGWRARLRQLVALVTVAVALLAGAWTTGAVAGLLPWLPSILARTTTIAVGVVVDLGLFLLAYGVLLPRPSWRVHLPGASLAAVGWAGLTLVGATVVSIRLQAAGAVYGTLAGAATVLLLLYVMARLFLTGAVLSSLTEERSVSEGPSATTSADVSSDPQAWLRGVRLAHRGLHAPEGPAENSLAAFAAAREAGLGVELDVRLSADGVAVVVHDALLPDGRRIVDTAAVELADLGVPSLADTLALLISVPVMVEVKQDGLLPRIGPLEAAVARVLDGHTGHVCVASFQPRTLAWFARHRPVVVRVLTVGTSRLSALTPVRWLARPHALSVTVTRLAAPGWSRLRRRGVPVLAWTVREVADLAAASPLADGLIVEGEAARRSSASG
jgi:uncharacterized BrkB/YihY/UPF0761 family membrane protein/glycerophosphoryl diester phosphodiesterase